MSIRKMILSIFVLLSLFMKEVAFSQLNFKASLLKIDPNTDMVKKILIHNPYSFSQYITSENNQLYVSGIVFSPYADYYQWITDLNGKVIKSSVVYSSNITDISPIPVTSNSSSIFITLKNQLFTSDLTGNISGPVQIYSGGDFYDNLYLDTNSNLYYAGEMYDPDVGYNSGLVVKTTTSGSLVAEYLLDEPGSYYAISKNNSTVTSDLTSVGVNNNRAYLTLWGQNIVIDQEFIYLSSHNSVGYSVTSFGNKVYTLGIDATTDQVVVWSYDDVGDILEKNLYQSEVPLEEIGISLGSITSDGTHLFAGFTVPTGVDTTLSFFYVLDSNMNIIKTIPIPDQFVIIDLILKNGLVYITGIDYSISQEELFFEAVNKYSPLKFQKGVQ